MVHITFLSNPCDMDLVDEPNEQKNKCPATVERHIQDSWLYNLVTVICCSKFVAPSCRCLKNLWVCCRIWSITISNWDECNCNYAIFKNNFMELEQNTQKSSETHLWNTRHIMTQSFTQVSKISQEDVLCVKKSVFFAFIPSFAAFARVFFVFSLEWCLVWVWSDV